MPPCRWHLNDAVALQLIRRVLAVLLILAAEVVDIAAHGLDHLLAVLLALLARVYTDLVSV
jgi:hypothetical protein